LDITRTPPRFSWAGFCWVALAAVTALGMFASPAAAAKPCERQVIDDWYDNGRVDQIYKAECYRKAVRILPTDVIDYSSAKDDILRALSFALRGAADPGDSGSSTATTPTTTPAQTTPTTTAGPATKPKPKPAQTTATEETVGELTEALPAADSSSSSVPIPLLVLGGLAILLFAAGTAGYLSRRFRANGPGGDPPAGA
jgi:hypothetical protein